MISLSFIVSSWISPGFFKDPELILTATEKTGIGVGHWLLNLMLIVGINTLVAPFLNILMFLGEEIGWRSYLFPRLLMIYSPKLAFLVCGTIWGLWHSAGILMGHNYPNHPLLGNFFMVLLCIPLGVILQYLYFKSRSIITAAIAHGVVNWTAMNFIMFMVADPDYNKLLYGPTGLLGIALMWIVAYVLAGRISWVKENPLGRSVTVPYHKKPANHPRYISDLAQTS